MSRFEVIYLPCQKTTSWKPCWTFNRCSTRQSAPLGFRRLCRTAAGQLEQRREMQQRRRAECEAWRGVGMDGEDLSWRRRFLWWFFVNGLRLIFVWWFWIFGLFMSFLELMLTCFEVMFIQVRLSCLHHMEKFRTIGKMSSTAAEYQRIFKHHSGRQAFSCSKYFSIDRCPPVFGTTSQSVKSGNLFLLKQTLAALGIFISWTWILETCWNVKIDARLPW